MRWKSVRTGDKRIVTRFALFPIKIQGEVRWLELCKIEQDAYDTDFYTYPWHNIRFIDKDGK